MLDPGTGFHGIDSVSGAPALDGALFRGIERIRRGFDHEFRDGPNAAPFSSALAARPFSFLGVGTLPRVHRRTRSVQPLIMTGKVRGDLPPPLQGPFHGNRATLASTSLRPGRPPRPERPAAATAMRGAHHARSFPSSPPSHHPPPQLNLARGKRFNQARSTNQLWLVRRVRAAVLV